MKKFTYFFLDSCLKVAYYFTQQVVVALQPTGDMSVVRGSRISQLIQVAVGTPLKINMVIPGLALVKEKTHGHIISQVESSRAAYSRGQS